MSRSEVARQLERSHRRLASLRRKAEGEELGGGAPLRMAVEELGQTLEELSVALEELASANEELAQTQLEAEQHARRFLELFRSAPDAYIVTDECGVVREANGLAEEKLGKTARYLVGKPLLTLVSPDDRDEFLTCLSALRDRRARLQDRTLRFRAGFEASVSAVPEPADGGLEIRWMLRDVSDLRRAEREAREAEERIRVMLDAALDGFLSTDESGVIRDANAALCRIFGYGAKELVGRKAGDLLALPGPRRRRASLRTLVGSTRELIGLRKDGSTVPIRAAVGRAELEQGPALVATVRDLTGQRVLESRLRAAAVAAASAEGRERRRLAADLHDEVGQLLALASMKLGMLEQEGGGGTAAPLREVEDLVARARERAESLTFQLSPPVLHDVGLAAAAEWLAEEMERSYGLRVALERNGEPPLDDEVATTVFRALRELLINVARHARTERAEVALERQGGTLAVTVVDGGVGFDEASSSNGFGLMNVRERLEALGGGLEIESSTSGGGTWARMVVPVVAAD